jgi:hypothetical protein
LPLRLALALLFCVRTGAQTGKVFRIGFLDPHVSRYGGFVIYSGQELASLAGLKENISVEYRFAEKD